MADSRQAGKLHSYTGLGCRSGRGEVGAEAVGLHPLLPPVRLRGGEELVGLAPDHGTGERAQRVDPPG